MTVTGIHIPASPVYVTEEVSSHHVSAYQFPPQTLAFLHQLMEPKNFVQNDYGLACDGEYSSEDVSVL